MTNFLKTFDSSNAKQISGPVERFLLSRNHVKSDRRRFCFHPSSMGKCPRQIQLDFIEASPPKEIGANLRFVFDMGHALQEVYVKYMIEAGICTREDIERPMDSEEYNVHGHSDGYMPDKRWGFDIKTTRDPVVYYEGGKRKEVSFKQMDRPHEAYIWQMQAYMLCEPEATHYQILYINKNDQSVKEFRVPRDEAKIAQLAAMTQEITSANAERRLVPRPEGYHPYSSPCNFCPHKQLCFDDFAKVNWSAMDLLESGKLESTEGMNDAKEPD